LAADRTPRNIIKHTFLFLIIFLISACSQKTDWVKFRGESGNGSSSARISPPLGVRWKIKLQEGEQKLKTLNPPVVIGDTIYFGSGDGNFYALDVESGYMRWVFKSGAAINSIPYADKDKVYFGSKDGKLYALSRETGQEVWTFNVPSQINSQVERYGDYIIFVGDADAIYFLSPEGREQFTVDNPGWYHYTFLMADDVMYFGTSPRVSMVGPYDIKRRTFLWHMDLEEIGSVWYSVSAVRGNLVYFGTADGFSNLYLGFHAFNRHTGKMVWSNEIEGKLDGYSFEDNIRLFMRNMELLDFMAPAVWRDTIIFAGGDRAARGFNARNGEIRWEKEFATPVSSAPTVAGGRVYFGLLDDEFTPPKLVCISAGDGRLLWEMETDGAILSAPVIAGGRIIFGTDKSVFYVMEQVF
jgi:outer membrane protein assembly factor BamB